MKKSRRSAANPPQFSRPIVLVGLMGAGKSTVGRRLAQTLGVPFRDTDQEIATAAGCSIPDIFDIYGEDIFRDLERRVVKRLLEEHNGVLATGGGVFMQPELRRMIKAKGISIWLKAELDILVERVSRRNTRPLLQKGDKRGILTTLIEERYPVYNKADIAVNSDQGSHEKVVRKIIEALQEYAQGEKSA